MQFDFTTIQKWAYTRELDEDLDKSFETDPDWTERSIFGACSLEDVFHFVVDERCLKRSYFAQHLAEDLCSIYRTKKQLPFHFSRMQGIMDKDIYLAEVEKHAEMVYERCLIIDRMRASKDPALQALARELLDFRHALLDSQQFEYTDIIQRVHRNALPLFA